MDEGTYKLKVSCRNCKTTSRIEIKKGVRAEEDNLNRVMIDHNGVKCPNCGCSELIKSY